ncbi:MAG: PASTA domain-containing protein [Gammaproteobacteria bacterium PRO9]|nr:PASTA domain-containing protein [Gammaproteobacteria bacterium PRO9]
MLTIRKASLAAMGAAPGLAMILMALSAPASAAQYGLTLVRISAGSANGTVAAASLDGTEFVYDDAAGTVTQLSPSTTAVFKLGPATVLYSHEIRGAVFNVATTSIVATSYACIEGGFGAIVGASLCGNTTYGDDFTNETTLDYTAIPGTRTVGGDDLAAGPQQQLADYASAASAFDGATLLLQSPAWTANPGGAGIQLEFAVSAIIQRVSAPGIRGLDQPAAEAVVTGAGLVAGTVTKAHHPSVPAGTVVSQNPSACEACVPAGSKVDFVVSLGPVTGGAVPDLLAKLGSDLSALHLSRPLAQFLRYDLRLAGLAMARNHDFAAVIHLSWLAWKLQWLSGHWVPSANAAQMVAQANEITGRLRKGLQPPPQSGLRTMTSQGVERSFYLEMPSDYSVMDEPKPVVFMFHGTGGTYRNFMPGGVYTDEGSDLRQKIGNDAIIVIPNALPGEDGVNQWNYGYDFAFFQDLLADLKGKLVFDKRRVFATGHSSGAGFVHELGCRHGDELRAIAPSSGALISASCTGSIAVMQIQSRNDTVVSPDIVKSTRDFWVLYNGFNLDAYRPGTTDPCIDYSDGSSPYPVQWCFTDDTGRGGHQWWSKADAIWDFFATLPIAEPTTNSPPGGGNDRVHAQSDTTLTFTVAYPATIGPVWRLAAVLYPAGTQPPVYTSPMWFLNIDIDPGAATPGTQQTYTVPVKIFSSSAETPLPGNYAVSIGAYVTGGGFPTPVAGIDHMAFRDVRIVDQVTPIVVDGVFDVTPVP